MPRPTKAGFTFEGWFTDASCTGTKITTIPAGSTGNKTFWAKWEEVTVSSYLPEKNATSVYEDETISITFDSAPTLGTGNITISGGTTTQTISVAGATTNTQSDGSSTREINVKKFNVQVVGTQVVIIPAAPLENNKQYTITIPNGAINGTINGANFTGINDWKFTTRTKHTPSSQSNITVDCDIENTSADFRTVSGAMRAVTADATIKVAPGTYRENIYFKKNYNLKIEGTGTAQYGSDVVLQGINCVTWNNGTDTRPSFWFGGKNLTLKNVTLQNAYTRSMESTGNNQAETIYFNSSGKLVAYNSSFKSYQDTILTKGKNWFYKCYVEGDVDFMWGYADVALFEECSIKTLGTSAGGSSAAYLFETRVGKTSADTVGKGYVLFKSTVQTGTTTYFARRATNKTNGSNGNPTNYYDQVAIIDTTFTANGGSVNSNLWYIGNEPEYIAEGSEIPVGWKAYGGSGYTAKTGTGYGTISKATHDKEYNGRNVILNSVYNKKSKTYEQATEIWDVTSLATEFNATLDTSTLPTATSETYIWDFASMANSAVNIQGNSKTGTIAYNSGTGTDASIKLNVSTSSTGGKLYTRGSSNPDAQFNSGTTISFPVESGDIVTIVSRNGTAFTVSGTAATGTTFTYEATANGTCDIVATGTNYLTSITLKKDLTGGTTPIDPTPTDFDFTKAGTVNLTWDDLKGFGSHEGNTGSYRGISLDATTGKWGPRDSDIQVNAGVKMSFTVAANTTADDITVSFTAAAGDSYKPTVEKSVSGTTATLTFTAGYPSTMTVVIAAPSGSGGGSSGSNLPWTANFLDIVGGTALGSDTAFYTTSSGYTTTDPKSGYAEYAFGNPAALIVYSKGGLRSRKDNGNVNYNGGLTKELTTTVGTTLSETIDRYVGIDISKLASSGTITVKFEGTAKPTSNTIQTDKPGQVVLIDQNGKILAAQSDLKTNSNSTTYTNTSFSLTADIDASEVTKVKLVFSRGGMACDKSSTDATASTGGGIDVTSITATAGNGGSSVPEKILSSISIATQPTKKSYTVGDTLNLSGLVVKATYSDSSTKNVTGYTCSPASGTSLSTAGTQTVNVSYTESGVKETTSFTVNVAAASSGSNTISVNDSPIGFASIDAKTNFGGKGGTAVRVTTAAKFKEYAESSTAYIIYVDGMIDLSGGMLPTTAGGSTDDLDSFVVTKTASYEGATDSDTDTSKYYKFTSYSDFKTKYAKSCNASSDDKTSSSPKTVYGKTLWKLNSDYQAIVKVNVNSNKTIIGVGSNSGLKGGTLNISSKNNIAIRNMTLQDAYDPFPHHEKNDGFNAELDCIVVQGSSYNIWIDHCTLKDTLYASNVSISGGGSEKWQTFDGLCDIKGSTKNVTVSNCYFYDHDKTMLIGSSDTDGSNATRTVTLVGNYFHNCGQRLPMVRNTRLHAYNNYYYANNPHYTQQYAIGVRSAALIFAENNYFEGIKYAYKDGEHSKENNGNGSVYHTGDGGTVNESFTGYADEVSEAPFTPTYDYAPMTAAAAKTYATTNAGVGKWTVSDTIPTN